MEWQDAVFGLGGIVFLLALLPSVLQQQSPALSTSVSTAIMLVCFAAAYGSLGYYFSGVVAVLTAGVWLVLARQRAGDRQT
jgi:NhaP-type Na+/H+ or K+/H+ antiporter